MNPNQINKPSRRAIGFSLAEDDFISLHMAAYQSGMNVSEYLRQRLGIKSLKEMQLNERLRIAAIKQNAT